MLSKSLPEAKRAASDRAPTVEEIKKLVEYPSRVIKPIVFTMCSSGIRLGAWDYLKWKHVIPKTNEKTGEILAAKLIVYAEEHDEHFSFITPEAYDALKEWMDYRAKWGEKITGESWLMRDKWPTVDKENGRTGLVKYPKKMGVETIKKRLQRALEGQGLRQPLPPGKRRHEWKEAHGFRKFFETHALQASMITLHVEYLMNHKLGLAQSYMKPTEEALFNDYLKAVPALTIHYDKDKTVLEKQVAELAEKEKEETEQTKKELEELKLQNDNNNTMLRSVMRILGEMYVKGGEGVDAKTIHRMLLKTSIYYDGQGIDGNAYILSLLDRKIKEEEERMKKNEKKSS